jgi:predicted GIY-YIG superfamily endonuclease
MKRERAIKAMTRLRKLRLIARMSEATCAKKRKKRRVLSLA